MPKPQADAQGQESKTLKAVSGVLTPREIQHVRAWVVAGCQPQAFEELEVALDFKPTLSEINVDRDKWPFHVYDRDVFRPLQYCLQYLWIDSDWITRGVVQMSCLHLEALVKRISGSSWLPLGRSLKIAMVRRKIPPKTLEQLWAVTKVYNDSKHKMDHPIGTHLFKPLDAWLIHFASRRLGSLLFSLAGITK